MRKKQGLLVILDGMGDRPNEELNFQTPLEAADTPNMNYMAAHGMCGNVYPISPGKPVGTDVGHLHIFGYDSAKVYSGRGPLEAISAGMKLEDGDVAFRGNFGTVDENFIVTDRRAGRIRELTDELAAAVNDMVLSDGTRVLVRELTEHRVAVVFRKAGLSDKISGTDPGTAEEGKSVQHPEALDGSPEAVNTAENLWEFTRKCYEILDRHPVNLERQRQGLKKANVILTRGAGKKQVIPTLRQQYKIKAACVAGDKTVGGIAGLAGMDYYLEDCFTGSFDTNLERKANLALELINEKKYDWVVVHLKATDLAGHDNLPLKKKEFIERADSMIGILLKGIDLNECYLSMTADHSTPCTCKDHTGDGVPTIICGGDVRRDEVTEAGERYFMRGALNSLTANDIFMLQMDFMGFVKKIGS